MSLLTVERVSVTLGNAKGEFTVLDELSFALAPGKALGLVGESGAGKSMIGRTIAQLLPQGFTVRGGALQFDGRDMLKIGDAERRGLLGRDIAFIPQEPLAALNPVLTIGQQIREHLAHIAAAPGRKPAADWRATAIEALDAVHLHDPAAILGKYPHQLSGGMCQRVLIAMAFLSQPKLLIADEPTTALDVSVQARIVALIGEMQRRYGTAVIFITHDLARPRDLRQCAGALRRQADRVGSRGRDIRPPRPSLYAGAATCHSAHRSRAARAIHPARSDARPDEPEGDRRMLLRATLSGGATPLLGRTATRSDGLHGARFALPYPGSDRHDRSATRAGTPPS